MELINVCFGFYIVTQEVGIPVLNVEDLGPGTSLSLCSPEKRWEYRNQTDTQKDIKMKLRARLSSIAERGFPLFRT